MVVTGEKSRQLDDMVNEINIAAMEPIEVSDEGVIYSYKDGEEIKANQNKLVRTFQYLSVIILLVIMIVVAIFGSRLIFGQYDNLFSRLFKNTSSDSNNYSHSMRV